MIIPYEFCDHIVGGMEVPDLKTLELNELNVEELRIYKISIIYQLFIERNISWIKCILLGSYVPMKIQMRCKPKTQEKTRPQKH